ncbi:hypothetical protein FHX69_7112 [Prauserella muralis]|uniref:Uncharacterized protein n=1 Tax=Amycolatopsis roodepoortensis TaxID=700274 RepID=A0ABR9LGR3_9PSEU|nr:hypothetical protein [Amycolatopsis roodepoortensis]TWE14946.1 hypothetical protein FHX69_7112 [Prauserella muralis]
MAETIIRLLARKEAILIFEYQGRLCRGGGV